MILDVEIPIRLSLGLNAREHWRARAVRVKRERGMVLMAIRGRELPALPAVITITRIGKRKADSDNVPGSAKAVRDQVADLYGIDDGSDLFDWRYSQAIGKEFAVRIKIVGKGT